MPLTLGAPPAEIISLAEAKVHCSIDADITVWDANILLAIKAARAHAEHITQRFYPARSARLTLDEFPCGDFDLSAAPVRSILSVTYVDGEGFVQTVPDLDYILDSVSEPCCLLLAEGASWPTSSGANSVFVDMEIGYEDRAAVEAVYPDAIAWMLLHIGSSYKDRDLASKPSPYADRLLDSAHTSWTI
jgi:uncharacterized phiE125 gp8 family phage protein